MRLLISLIFLVNTFSSLTYAQETSEGSPFNLPSISKSPKKMGLNNENPIFGKWCYDGERNKEIYYFGEKNVARVESTTKSDKTTIYINGTYKYSSFNKIVVQSLKNEAGVAHNYYLYKNGELHYVGFTRKDVDWKSLEISDIKKLLEDSSYGEIRTRCPGDLNS